MINTCIYYTLLEERTAFLLLEPHRARKEGEGVGGAFESPFGGDMVSSKRRTHETSWVYLLGINTPSPARKKNFSVNEV